MQSSNNVNQTPNEASASGQSRKRAVLVVAAVIVVAGIIAGIIFGFQFLRDGPSLALLQRGSATPTVQHQTATPAELSPAIAVDTSASPVFTVSGEGWSPVTDVVIGLMPEAEEEPNSGRMDEFHEVGAVTTTREGTFFANFMWETQMPASNDTHVLAFVPGTQHRAAAPFDLYQATPTPVPTPTITLPALPTPRTFVLPSPIPLPTIPTSTPFPTLALPTFAAPESSAPLEFTPAPSGRDGYEPDDTAEEASYIALGETQTHSFYPTGDVDRVRFRIKPDRRYRIYTDNLALGVDTKLILAVGATGCEPEDCQNDDVTIETLASEVTVVSAADGIGWATVINLDQYGESKTYQLTFDVSKPPPTPTPSRTLTPSTTPTPSKTPTITPTPLPTYTWTPSPTPAASPTLAPTPTPAELIAPGNLSCQPAGPTNITLQWADYTLGESNFRVERSTDGETWTEVATVGANATNASVPELAPDTRYWFRLRAHRESDDVFSPYTNVVSCTTPLE